MFSQEAIAIVGTAISVLLALTGFLSAQAFNRLTRELDAARAELAKLDRRVTRVEAVCEARHRARSEDV